MNNDARIIRLLSIGAAIRRQIGRSANEAKGIEPTGMKRQLWDIENELRSLMQDQGVTELSHEGITFSCHIENRGGGYDYRKLSDALVVLEVPVNIINAAFAMAEREGSPSWIREWKEQ